ncbi:hypothetical protein ID866_1761 [Astraeus odoratus]|nr:hypothetical protein ID866_1761 [Astraeus odoratus]
MIIGLSVVPQTEALPRNVTLRVHIVERYWQSLISVPAPVGYAHPAEPQCVYDPVDGLTLAPDTDPIEKIRMLEEEVCKPFPEFLLIVPDAFAAKLKIQLQEQTISAHGPGPSVIHRQAHGLSRPSSSSSASGSQPVASQLSCPDLSHLNFRQNSHGQHVQTTIFSNPSDDVLELIHTGWNTDLPDPHVLNY